MYCTYNIFAYGNPHFEVQRDVDASEGKKPNNIPVRDVYPDQEGIHWHVSATKTGLEDHERELN